MARILRQLLVAVCAVYVPVFFAGLSYYAAVAGPVSALTVIWAMALYKRRHRTLYSTADPSGIELQRELGESLKCALGRAIDGGKPVLLRLNIPNGCECVLAANKKGGFVLNRHKHAGFEVGDGGAWIADHPLPFVFSGGAAELLFTPVGAGRVRVGDARGLPMAAAWWLLPASVLVWSCVAGYDCASAIVAGAMFGKVLSDKC